MKNASSFQLPSVTVSVTQVAGTCPSNTEYRYATVIEYRSNTSKPKSEVNPQNADTLTQRDNIILFPNGFLHRSALRP